MRALAISDMHFGAWTGDSLLTHRYALERLEPRLDEVDEVILLGDVFDLLFSSVEYAFRQSGGFDLLQRKLRGKRVVFLAGNHDHHIVVRTLRSAVATKVACGMEGEELERTFAAEYRNFFQRFLDRRLAGVETEIVYPSYTVGDVLLTHGHYLDAHLSGSVPNRILTRASWTIAGGRPDARITEQDCEAVIVPLTELLFTVAQMPRGCAVQMGFHRVRAHAPTARRRCGRGCRGVRFWNTGSWIHAPSRTSRGAYANYLRRAWPGTGVLIDTERPEPTLIEMLADRSPANASNGGTRRRSPLGRFVPGPLGSGNGLERGADQRRIRAEAV
jgi:hypothetical protein